MIDEVMNKMSPGLVRFGDIVLTYDFLIEGIFTPLKIYGSMKE